MEVDSFVVHPPRAPWKQRDTTNVVRMWVLSDDACCTCRGPADAHGKTSPMRVRTIRFKPTAKTENQGRFASSLNRMNNGGGWANY